eukprot:527616-Pyramimonas_sp.AAC.1
MLGPPRTVREAFGHHPPSHPNRTRSPQGVLHSQWGGRRGIIEETHLEPVPPPTRTSGLRVRLGWTGG